LYCINCDGHLAPNAAMGLGRGKQYRYYPRVSSATNLKKCSSRIKNLKENAFPNPMVSFLL
jgi:hypothetical protein